MSELWDGDRIAVRTNDPPRGKEGHVAEILVRHLMGKNAAQLVVVGAVEKSGGDEEFAIAGVGGVDFRLVDDADAYLIQAAWSIHRTQQRSHHRA